VPNNWGIILVRAGFTAEEFLEGLHIELEHGLVDALPMYQRDRGYGIIVLPFK
jgi:hypothetical protein